MPKTEKTPKEIVLEKIEALRECLATCEKEVKNGDGKLPDPIAQEGHNLSRAIRRVNLNIQQVKSDEARARRAEQRKERLENKEAVKAERKTNKKKKTKPAK